MPKGCRRDEDGSPRGEFNHHLEVPQDQVAAPLRIEITKGGNCAPPEREIPGIPVIQAARLGAKIEGRTGEHTVLEVTSEAFVAGKQGFVVLGIVGPELGCPRREAC